MAMNIKRTAIILLTAFAALSLASCVHDEEAIFEDSATVRLQKALSNAQTVLTGAENGWRMYYYPDPDQSYGGFVYTMKFTQEEVEVWSELFEESSKSLYKMATDNGPVLSFDTGNYNFHYFATPSGSSRNLYGDSQLYQGHKGDFEFLIVSATPEEVVLSGKRTGNRIVMYPLAAGEDPKEVADAVYACSEQVFVSTFEGTIGSDAASAYLYLSDRWISMQLTGDQYAEVGVVGAPYAYTETGIIFYEPVELGPYTIEGFRWEESTQSLVALDGASTSASLKGELPEGWRAYGDFIGDFDLVFNDNGDWWSSPRTASVSIVQDVEKQSYLLKGVNENYDLKLTYNLSTGGMQLLAQVIGEWGENLLLFAPCSGSKSSSGGLTWSGWASTSYGMNIIVNEEKTAEAGTLVAEFVPGPQPSATQPINMFALVVMGTSGSFVGWGNTADFTPYHPFNFRYYAPFWVSLTKK